MIARTAGLLLLWTLVVLYPNPLLLLHSAERAFSPQLDVEVVRDLAATLPDDPRQIEAIVNSELVPYEVPWQTYSVPWYFPTVRQVLQHGAGDCQARAIVLASILKAKGIPATFVGSFDHLWVDYPGKHANALENAEVVLVVADETGAYDVRWPELIDWRTSWEIERAYFWDELPTQRLTLLLVGWAWLIARSRSQ